MTAVTSFGLNTRGRDLVVGDVHGCFTKLAAALDAVQFNPDAGDRLFLLGDLIDRGPESAQVLDWLRRPGVFAIMGNHEQMALGYAAGLVDAGLYARNGGAWFIAMTKAEQLPYLDAFLELPVAIELNTPAGLLGLVHADCPRPSWSDFVAALGAGEGQVVDAALWSRSRIDARQVDAVEGVVAVLVGHTPVERFTSLGNVLYLDTGAWLQGGASPRGFTILNAATLLPVFASSLTFPADS